MKIKNKERYTVLGLSLLSAFILFIIYRLMMLGKDGYIYVGHDTMFHKARIDGLYHAFQNGVWFPKINYMNLEGSGYASSLFYSDIFLYPTTLLRFLGVDSHTSYQASFLLWNSLTFVMSYYAMKPIFNDKNKQILFSFLYVFSPYIIYDTFIRGALGEVIAISFLPVALSGLYQIIYGNHKKWWVLTIGMIGIVHSHILTTAIFSIMILFFIISEWKVVFTVRERLLSLVKATLLTIGCSLWFLLPMMEQMAFQVLKVSESPVYNVGDDNQTILNVVYKNILGAPLDEYLGVLALIVMFWYVIHYRKISSRFLRVSTIICVVFFLSTTTILPWDLLGKTPLNVIQFPWRFFIVVNLLTVMLFCSGEIKVLRGYGSRLLLTISLLFSVTLYFTTFYQSSKENVGKYYTFDVFHNDVKDIGYGQEYLPLNFEYIHDKPLLTIPDYNQEYGEVLSFTRQYDTAQLEYVFDKPTELTIPYTYYKGYVATVNGDTLPIFESTKHPGRVAVMVEGFGTLTVQYKNTPIQNVSKVISVFSVIGLLHIIFKDTRQFSNRKRNHLGVTDSNP